MRDIKYAKNKSKEVWELLLQNIPNILTVSRFILTLFVVYLIFNGKSIWSIVIVFTVAALTDFFDGRLARKFHWESEFGRKTDMVADRVLWIGTGIAFITYFSLKGQISWVEGIQMLFIFAREIISAPFVIVAAISGNLTPHARYIAKVTTFIQGFALPLLILSLYYKWIMYISIPISIACLLTGTASALYYLKDIRAPHKEIKKK